jgi:hypothetical protein
MQLFEFSFFPPKESLKNNQVFWLNRLADLLSQENWGEDHRFLQYYCLVNFDIALNQHLIYENQEFGFAAWRIGHLTSPDGIPVYMIFERNKVENRQPYILKNIIATRYPFYQKSRDEKYGFPPLLEPVYHIPPYGWENKIQYNWNHYLQDRKSRLEQFLAEITNDRIRYLAIFGAVESSHRLWRQNAIPQYYDGTYGYLLPLFITHVDFARPPDLVATLFEDVENEIYIAGTLLPPEWAYPYARAIHLNTAPFRSWVPNETENDNRPLYP